MKTHTEINNILFNAGFSTLQEDFNKSVSDITAFCAKLQEKMLQQLIYSHLYNVPTGTVKKEEVVNNAIETGICAAFSERNEWFIEPNQELAASLCEDVNAHRLAKAIREFNFDNVNHE